MSGSLLFHPNESHLPLDARGPAEADTWRRVRWNLSSQECWHEDIGVALIPASTPRCPHLSPFSRLRSLSSTAGWKSHLAPPPSSEPEWVSSREEGWGGREALSNSWSLPWGGVSKSTLFQNISSKGKQNKQTTKLTLMTCVGFFLSNHTAHRLLFFVYLLLIYFILGHKIRCVPLQYNSSFELK